MKFEPSSQERYKLNYNASFRFMSLFWIDDKEKLSRRANIYAVKADPIKDKDRLNLKIITEMFENETILVKIPTIKKFHKLKKFLNKINQDNRSYALCNKDYAIVMQNHKILRLISKDERKEYHEFTKAISVKKYIEIERTKLLYKIANDWIEGNMSDSKTYEELSKKGDNTTMKSISTILILTTIGWIPDMNSSDYDGDEGY